MTNYKDIKRIPIVAADVPNLDASKITTGTLDNARITLDAAEIPNLDTAKITTGTMADARISAGSVTQHVAATDLVPLKQDIATLALHSAIADNKTAHNLPNYFIDQFEDDTGILTETDVDRNASEYISSVSGNFLAVTKFRVYMNQTAFDIDWSIQGSADGSSWTDLSTGWNWHFTGWGERAFSNSTAYRYYRLLCTSGTPYSGNWLNEIQIYTGSYTQYDWSSPNHPTVTHNDTSHFGGWGSHSITAMTDGYTGTSGTFYVFGPNNLVANTSWIRFEPVAQTVNATGTLISNAQTASSATTKLSGVFLYKDNTGTATLGTDLKIYLSANNGTNFTEIPSYGTVSPLFSTGIKMIRMPETTVTSGTSIKLKAVWANQSSSKETQLHGWAVNY